MNTMLDSRLDAPADRPARAGSPDLFEDLCGAQVPLQSALSGGAERTRHPQPACEDRHSVVRFGCRISTDSTRGPVVQTATASCGWRRRHT